MKIFAVLLCVMGSFILYCSHCHQSLLKQYLAKHYVYVGLALLMISIILLLMSVPKLVAVYMWLMTMLMVWSLVPFIVLFKKNIAHEISTSTKNPS